MHKLIVLGALLCCCLLTACAGGTIGGLIPAPKILDGDLDGRVYTSPDKLFSARAPVRETGGEWLYTRVFEGSHYVQNQRSQSVGFKTPYDSHYFTVEVAVSTEFPFNDGGFGITSADNIQRYIRATEERWGAEVAVIADSRIDCGTHSYSNFAIHQHVVDHDPVFDKYLLISQRVERGMFTIAMSELNYVSGHRAAPIEEIQTATFERHNEFACSIVLYDYSRPY